MTRSASTAFKVIGITCVIALLILYFIIDPAESRFAPKCMVHLVTGWECPGCGSQRMIHALLHGDLAAAWHFNAMLLCMLPVVAVMLVAAALRTRMPKFYAIVNSVYVIVGLAIIIMLWGVVRNFI